VPDHQAGDRLLQHTYVTDGIFATPIPLAESREHLREALISIPWEGLKLSAGDPAITVTVVPSSVLPAL
jgi:nicotinate phosphoribosyltransferase